MPQKKTTTRKPKATPKHGRPTVYSKGVADVILTHMRKGGFLEPFLDSREDLPAPSTVYEWLVPKSPRYKREFCDAYARVRGGCGLSGVGGAGHS